MISLISSFFFSKRIVQAGIANNSDTDILFQYVQNFVIINHIKINSIDDLIKEGMSRYFKFKLIPKVNKRKLQVFTVGDDDYYIKSGVFIFPIVVKLFERNQSIDFDDFISDTTWFIIPNYVTAILMVSFLNTSLPLAFGFGQGETCSLYTLLLKTVEEKVNIDFKGSIFESD